MLSDRKLFCDQIVSVVSTVFGEDRAGSLKFRFDNEKILSDKARQKMIFGGDGDEAVFNEWRKDISVTDSVDCVWRSRCSRRN